MSELIGKGYGCGDPQIRLAQTVLLNYCQANADGVLFTTVNNPNLGGTPTGGATPTPAATPSQTSPTRSRQTPSSSIAATTLDTLAGNKSFSTETILRILVGCVVGAALLGLSIGAIVGIVMGCLVGAALLVLGIYICIKCWEEYQRRERQYPVGGTEVRGVTSPRDWLNSVKFAGLPSECQTAAQPAADNSSRSSRPHTPSCVRSRLGLNTQVMSFSPG
ncbi:hypothetical protein PV11_09833 [Exophiala sideris]|uniref:Uncharacterized protein n=1 Tax=Exophiala sideris TaxID=1016849 RepID=A0A0D1WSM2_9EURO|nr:hypothetical protein PV11_09833 [Exophiala sideris]